jgi:hypothetical protein
MRSGLCSSGTGIALVPCYQRLHREVLVVAIKEYVRSLASGDTVSKAQVFRYLEMQFARIDRNHDGLLDRQELAVFVQSITRPEMDHS